MSKNKIKENRNKVNKFNIKKQKRNRILDYVKKIYQNENRIVSKREIRKVFHLELYNYFQSIFDMYQRINVKVPLCFCPKDYAKKKIIEFIKERSSNKLYPTKNEIEKELNIHILTYFRNLRELYKKSNVEFRLYEKRKYDIGHTLYSEEEINKIRNKIYAYIKKNTKKGNYPSVHDVQRDLKIAFYKYFLNIKTAYSGAGVNYYRPCPILLGKEKEIAFTNIVITLLKKMNFKIKRVSIYDKKLFNKKEDIQIIDKSNNTILVELKAFRKNYNISKRELQQLKSYMDNQRIGKGLLITTSTKINCSFENIKTIDGNKLCDLLGITGLIGFLDIINWIQEEKVNLKANLIKKEKKLHEIIKYIRRYDGIPNKNTIEKNFKVDMRTYFTNVKNFNKLIKEIKNKPNNGSVQVCKGL